MLARGCEIRRGAYYEPEKPTRYVFVTDAARLRGLKAPLVYVLPRGRQRQDFGEIEPILIETKARLCFYPG